MAKHELGDIWKEDRKWKIQLPRGIHTVDTKRRAKLFSASVLDPNFTMPGAR